MNNELKKKLAELVSVDDWSDECGNCKRPALLHKGGLCMRQEKEPPDVVMGIWSKLRKIIKPIITLLKTGLRKKCGTWSTP